ncbi:hypothetical protein [Streptomyces sp. NPDC005507]|uniref:hypothetical protein n=1 Tax=Streptomyces sp. NPDC005507 TaxID=3154885 RepID=UPI0033A9454E
MSVVEPCGADGDSARATGAIDVRLAERVEEDVGQGFRKPSTTVIDVGAGSECGEVLSALCVGGVRQTSLSAG